MNRHQSNPFLSDWGDEDDGAKKETPNVANVFSDTNSHDRKRLYHRNMSSFEAASLQLEYQQQLQDDPSGDIIAQMTSEFQSAIETKDKDFGEHFDPFETIVDDDAVSLPSLIAATNQEQANESTVIQPTEEVETSTVNHVTEANELTSANNHTVEPALNERQEMVADDQIVTCELNQKLDNTEERQSNVAETKEANTDAKANNSNEDEYQETPAKATSISSTSIARPRPVAAKSPLAQNLDYSSITTKPITPRRTAKKEQTKKRSSFQEDSSDSSEEDERIKIVIRTNNTSSQSQIDPGQSGDAKPALMPLLPPPPSKNSYIQAARDAGQTIGEPSSPFKARTRRQSSSSSSSSPEDGKPQEVAVAKRADELDAEKENRRYEEEEEEDEPDDEGQFVIPMTHSVDEEDYTRPDTPLYDEDTSYVLEEYPVKYEGPGWDMMLRYPPKKKLTSNRFWKKIFVKLAQVPLVQDTKTAGKQQQASQQQQPQQAPQTCMALQIFDKPDDKKPMQEIPIQATYTVSEISSQQLDQFGKIFTIKLQYIFYKERVGVRQGQLARFIHSGHIGSSTTSGGHGVDPISIGAIKRIGAPIEHSPQISQIIKLGCTDYNEIKQFKNCLEDCLFKMPIHRDRALTTYKTEEVQMAVRDETYIELNQVGQITRQLARVRLFFLSFLNGMPTVEIGINEIHRQGREVVGRMDILPVVTEEWIRLEAWELHSTIDKEEFENPDSRIIKLIPPDATFFELMRFRIRPPRNRELPLQISANMSVTRTKVSITCDVMVPGSVSRKHGQIPCENIAIRIYMPECWIYFFREEKHFRMGSKKSVNRRPGKVKGIERFLGGGGAGGLQDINDDSSLIEVTSGQAKYEHHHHAIVWRAARWPKESQSAYVQNTMKIRLPLTAYDKMPDSFYEYVHVEYTMPATTVSHTTLRSISVNPYEDEPAEKYVKYSAKYDYKVKMRLSVNVRTNDQQQQVESSPIVIVKQPDLNADLQREEDSDDDEDDDETGENEAGAVGTDPDGTDLAGRGTRTTEVMADSD